MKWGRKKSAPSSSPPSIITRVFPFSWFSKSKKKGGNPETSSAKNKQRSEFDFPTPNASLPASWKQGRFYSMDEDDAYWRLSFGEERIQGRRSTGGINPLWYDSDHDFQVPVSKFMSFGLREMDVPRREETRNFSDMVLDIKKMKEREGKKKTLTESGAFRSKKANGEGELTSRRRKDVNDQISRKLSRRVVREKQAELETGPDNGEEKISNSGERDIFPVEPENVVQMKEDFWKLAVSNSRKQPKIPNFCLSSVDEDYVFEAPNGKGSTATSERVSISEWQNLEDRKFKEIKVKTESQKKSAYISRESQSRKIKQNNRVKAYSPRTECKIRALEDMKKARMKLKKKERKEQVEEGKTIFDSFAVVKSSFNPQQDFRDSMVEMIREKGLSQHEDLEELLACYLTLNCDEYHDLIIKVFRQVWFELNGVYINPQIQNDQYFDY
ncbi:hypothetical protein Pfo_023435 [Paulownia fortunei]|nr:hypothetical protein Pfo_023435 [Paulownia fortunei]